MDLKLEFISVVLLSLLAAPSAGCESYNLKDFLLPDFKDISVSDFLLSTLPGTEKLGMCTVKCRFDTKCISYQFNDLTNTCSLFGCGFSKPETTFLPITEESGWKLYRMDGRDQSFGHVCSTSDDCDYANSYCRDGRCECVLGFSYAPNTGSCVTHCAVYGAAFQAQPNHMIKDSNNDTLYNLTLTDCLLACLDRVSYVCRSLDFRPSDGHCNLSEKAWMHVPVSKRKMYSGWSIYTRHCATL